MTTPTLANPNPVETPEQQMGPRFRLPILVPEGTVTRDGRMWEKGSLWWSNGPWPLWALTENSGGGHGGAVLAGRIESITRDPGTSIVSAEGRFMLTDEALEAAKMVADQVLRGVSADLAQMKGVQIGPEIVVVEDLPDPDGNGVVKLPDETFDDTVVWLQVTEAEVMGATLCAAPGYKDAGVVLLDPVPASSGDGEGLSLVASVIHDIGRVVPESRRYVFEPLAAAASAPPVDPPAAWFEHRPFDGPTRLTIDDDGAVYGHLATWNTGHRGYLSRQVTPPHNKSGYAHFLTGRVRTAEGVDVPTGVLTMGGGHAPTTSDYDIAATKAFYDDVTTAVADLTVWEDEHGIACAGALRPGVTPEQVRTLRASNPSGDWRPQGRQLEMVAVHAVNVEGFPVFEQAVAASGQVLALVASFQPGEVGEVVVRSGLTEPRVVPEVRTELRIAALEAAVHGPKANAARIRITEVRKARALAKIDRERARR